MLTDVLETKIGFEKSVEQLQQNLQYLANKNNVSDAFISKQNHIIKNLIDFYTETKQVIDFYQKELSKNQMQLSKTIQEEADMQISFEAICIMHGIMDFPYLMSLGSKLLEAKAVDFYKTNSIQLPSALLDHFERNDSTQLFCYYENALNDCQHALNNAIINARTQKNNQRRNQTNQEAQPA